MYRHNFLTTAAGLLILATCCFHFGSVCHAQDSQRQITRSFTEPFETSDVAAAEQGIVRRIHVREGQSVKKGDLLAELDEDVLLESKRLAEAKATSKARVNAATAMLNIATMQKKNFEELRKEGHANASELNKVKAEFESAQAKLELAQDEATQNKIELDRIKAQLRQRRIISPMDAVVTEIHKRHGEFISSAEPKFATVVRLDRLRVRFYLHVNELDKLSTVKRVDVLVGMKKETRRAAVEFVSPVIDPDSGTGRVDLVIENPELKIRSGVVCYWQSASESNGALKRPRQHK